MLRTNLGRKNPFMKWFIIIGIIIVSAIATNIAGSMKTEIIYGKVIAKQIQQKISGSGNDLKTEIRYIVATDKETYVVENSVINLKFNNSDIYMRIDTGKSYTFKVCGWGKTMITDYRNILSIQ